MMMKINAEMFAEGAKKIGLRPERARKQLSAQRFNWVLVQSATAPSVPPSRDWSPDVTWNRLPRCLREAWLVFWRQPKFHMRQSCVRISAAPGDDHRHPECDISAGGCPAMLFRSDSRSHSPGPSTGPGHWQREAVGGPGARVSYQSVPHTTTDSVPVHANTPRPNTVVLKGSDGLKAIGSKANGMQPLSWRVSISLILPTKIRTKIRIHTNIRC